MSQPPYVQVESRGDGIVVVRVDHPPVNAVSSRVLESLEIAIATAVQDPGIAAIVLMGAGKTFIAGADIRELERAAWGEDTEAPDAHALLARMEDSPKPIVVAIHGSALGGGLEVAMAGHYRVASPDARLGMPEVSLGIIPGFEGTQRLPRLVGVEKAIEMIVSGKPIVAGDALAAGLVDRVVEGELESGAVELAREVADRAGALPVTRARADRLVGADALAPLLERGRQLARKTRRNETAPLAAIEAIHAAATLPFEEGIQREKALFLECLASEQCKAMLHAFFAERAVSKIPDLPADAEAYPLRTIGIVGAGTMGGGIAMACANAGLRVLLKETAADALERGMATIRGNYDSSVTRGRLTREAADERLARINPQLDYSGFEEADLLIEAVFESLELKKTIFSELDRVAKPDAVLGTNTSTLDIDAIAGATRRPEMVVGVHFFSPANVMRLLEIVRGERTGPRVIATAMALAKRLGKVGVLVRNGPGFVGNRMMFPYMYETQFLVEEGATPEQVDRVLTDWGMAMGMFAVDDMAGIDVSWRIRREMNHFADPALRRPLVVDQLVERGRLGQKSGKGWYRYDQDRVATPDPEVLELIERAASSAGLVRREIGREEIVERAIYALINEGARVLEEGYAMRASDIDIIYINGYGFPAWRGGPMFYADRVGLAAIVERIEALHREHGPRWAPAPLLLRLAAEGRTFRELDAERAGATL